MKRIILLLVPVLLLSGCAGDGLQEQALAIRSSCLGARECRFQAEITADYIDSVEEFTLDCVTDSDGILTFTVESPEAIAGITGTVSGEEGTLIFDDQILGFPLMAEDRLSPVSAPWIAMKALRSGYLRAYVQEGDLLHLTVDDSYADDALTVEVWARDGIPVAAEIAWQGRRAVSMEIENFTFG